ncbi:MAG: RDD family protein [Culicoidibacterales bacterium]
MQAQKSSTPEEQKKLIEELQKQMKAEALLRAPLWRRMVAYWIDITMYIGIVMIPAYLLQWTIMPDLVNNYAVMFCLMTAVFALLFVGETWVLKGQSIGKLALGIKIVSRDGQPITFGRLVLREMIGRFLLLPITFVQLIVYIFTGGRFVHDLLGRSKVIRTRPSKFMMKITQMK